MRITQVHVTISNKALGLQFEYVAVPGAMPGAEENPDDVIHDLLLRGQRLMRDHIDSITEPRETASPDSDTEKALEEKLKFVESDVASSLEEIWSSLDMIRFKARRASCSVPLLKSIDVAMTAIDIVINALAAEDANIPLIDQEMEYYDVHSE